MHPLSKTTAELAYELHRVVADRGLLRRSRTAEIAALLRKIGEASEPLAIPRIISLVRDDRREVAELAGDTIASLRERVSARDLGAFDRAFRELSWFHAGISRWHEMPPADVHAVAALRGGRTLVQLAMCHRSGYVRAEAIRVAATSADRSAIGFLLLRTNDWVAPVRALAEAAVHARLSLDHVLDFATVLPLIDAMSSWSRVDSARLLEKIEATLRHPDATHALKAALDSPDLSVRRSAYRRLFEREELALRAGDAGPDRSTSPPHVATVIVAALSDADTAIRSWAGHRLLAADNDIFLTFAAELLRCRNGAVRLGAAQRLLALGRSLPWSTLLLDTHAGVRAVAQGAALEAGTSPDDEYRARIPLATGARLGIALVGLAETGGPHDDAVLRAHLRGDQPVVRRSALLALARLQVDDIDQLALRTLLGESPAVTRVARELLLGRVSSLNSAEVWSAFAGTTSVPGKRAALVVLANLGYWEGLPYVVRAAGDRAVSDLASRYLERWLVRQNHILVPPPANIADELRSLLAGGGLRDDLRRGISAVLDARRPRR